MVNYWIRKAQDHDYCYETLAELSIRNECVSQYHKLEKKHKDAEARMEELEDQLEITTVKAHRSKIQETIHNLQKSIKKKKADMENVSDVKDQLDDECATNPYSKQIRQGKIRKEYALSHFYGYIHKCLKSWFDIYVQSK